MLFKFLIPTLFFRFKAVQKMINIFVAIFMIFHLLLQCGKKKKDSEVTNSMKTIKDTKSTSGAAPPQPA
ncbi:unnamed protein product [Caenorhabditis angaria]|uniref:Uncharacterized protein n=1 Tax=Caenorhabditis angaria TaxID=860376 RepID=A0A9P1IC78_9PELO|nr:unnamed protein product [Caenorhabditis angaria]